MGASASTEKPQPKENAELVTAVKKMVEEQKAKDAAVAVSAEPQSAWGKAIREHESTYHNIEAHRKMHQLIAEQELQEQKAAAAKQTDTKVETFMVQNSMLNMIYLLLSAFLLYQLVINRKQVFRTFNKLF